MQMEITQIRNPNVMSSISEVGGFYVQIKFESQSIEMTLKFSSLINFIFFRKLLMKILTKLTIFNYI